ncbi:hypothetical protein [Gordonia sp. (in: high G+C Gram-positive bacteria)]|uniref:hypothetical protein n=1 Tax=Gordonia sp. (in: high G+C Gram-positive bacteria) TaxID=84139 RepID=UPI0033414382
MSTTAFGERVLNEIVEDILDRGDAAESAGLEVKSELDLTKRGLGIAKAAKFILGAANRDVAVAQKLYGGRAIMVIGVAKGQAPGVAPGVEAHQVADRLRAYFADPEPPWDLLRIPARDVPGNEVLFLIVEPPQPGDPIRICSKNFQPDHNADRKYALVDGGIYVRDKSQTRTATSADLKRLTNRAATTTTAEPNVEVSITRALLVTDESADDGRKRWIEIQENAYRSTRPAEPRRLEAYMPMPYLSTSGKHRYRHVDDVIADGVDHINEHWPEVVDYFAKGFGGGNSVTIGVSDFIKSPELVLTIPNAQAHWYGELTSDGIKEVFPPLLVPDDAPFSGANLVRAGYFHPSPPVAPEPDLDFAYDNDGSLIVTCTPPSLRPGTPWVSEELTIFIESTTPLSGEIDATWTLTGEGIGLLQGTITLPIDAESRSLQEALSDAIESLAGQAAESEG